MAAPDNPIEPPGSNPDAGGQLKSWLRSLAPTKVDLVGDFAGKERFAIHGEALLAHCLHTMKVDFDCMFGPIRALSSACLLVANHVPTVQMAFRFCMPFTQLRLFS